MKSAISWFSDRIGQEIELVRWGYTGVPVLMFPTAGGDAEEIERFLLVDALGPLLADGRIKVYSLDSVNGRSWLTGAHPEHASWLQSQFHDAIRAEVVPAVRRDCESENIELITAGSSIGALNAMAMVCAYPDVFTHAICMSGTYDLSPWLAGTWPETFYRTSPIHYVPDMAEDDRLDRLRQRFVLLAHGSGAWENPEESWRAAAVLGARGIPNRVDDWGPDHPHDWQTWRQMLPHYLDEPA